MSGRYPNTLGNIAAQVQGVDLSSLGGGGGVYDDSTAHLGVSTMQGAINALDAKTDQIDVVNAFDYTAYIDSKI